MPEEFYKDKIWEMLLNELKDIKENQRTQSIELGKIKDKINWIYGWAAGVGALATIIITYIKDKIIR